MSNIPAAHGHHSPPGLVLPVSESFLGGPIVRSPDRMHPPVRSPEGSDSDSDSDATIDINNLDDLGLISRWELGCPLQRMVRLDSISLGSSSSEPSQSSLVSHRSTVQDGDYQEQDREHQLKNLYRACMAAELESSENIDDDSDSDTSSIGWDDIDFEAVIDTFLEANSTMAEDTYVLIYPSLESSTLGSNCSSLTFPALSAPLTLHPITLLSPSPYSAVESDEDDQDANLLLLYLTLSTPELRADPWNPVPRILRAVDRPSVAEPEKTTVYLFHPPLAPLSTEDCASEKGNSEGQQGTGTVAHWIDFFRQILEGLTFLHECGVAWGGFPSSKSHLPSDANSDLPMFMMDVSADPSVSALPHGISVSDVPYSFDRSKYPVKYYFTDFRNARQLPISTASSSTLHTKFSSQYSAQLQLFTEDVRACGAWIESLLSHLPPLVQPLLPLTRAMTSGTFGADDARKLFEARVRSLAKHVWEQAIKEVGWKLSGEVSIINFTSPRTAAMRRAKTVGPIGPKQSQSYSASVTMPPDRSENRDVRATGPMVRSKSDPVPSEGRRHDVFGDLSRASALTLPGTPVPDSASRVMSNQQTGKAPHHRSFSARVGVAKF